MTRLLNKTKKLFDPIQKINKIKKVSAASKKIDIRKETISAIQNIEYARLRDYIITELLGYKSTSTAFFVMKDGYLRKSTKSEFWMFHETIMTMITIDFMAYMPADFR